MFIKETPNVFIIIIYTGKIRKKKTIGWDREREVMVIRKFI